MSQEIGIIGVGKMGAAMWRCLARRGSRRPPSSTRSRPPPRPWPTPARRSPRLAAELAAAVDVVILSLPNSGDVEGVVADIASALRPGVVVIDTTSGEPAVSRRVAATVAATGAAYLDAGVSGGPPGAEAGTLKIMVGGDADRVRPGPARPRHPRRPDLALRWPRHRPRDEDGAQPLEPGEDAARDRGAAHVRARRPRPRSGGRRARAEHLAPLPPRRGRPRSRSGSRSTSR